MNDEMLAAVSQARVTLLLGEKDTGKTTLLTKLAKALFRQGDSVAVIDADIGQSDIGPPTTIGFAQLSSEIEYLRDLAPQRLYFVGSTSPKGHVLPQIMGTRKMLDNAVACGAQRILIDTTGLVRGHLGRVLKEQKIAMVEPDLILCVQRQQECEHILRAYASFHAPKILRCLPAKQCREKSQAARQRYREEKFSQYFATASEVTLSLDNLGIFESRLFSGIPIEEPALSCLMNAMQNPQNSGTTTFPRILWGERVEDDWLLVTAEKLNYQHLMAIKTREEGVSYIHNLTPADLIDMLIGILDSDGACCGLGIVRALDFQRKTVTLLTPADPQQIAGLQFSSYLRKMSTLE